MRCSRKEATIGARDDCRPGAVEHADDEVVDRGEETGCAAGADLAGVFAVGGVAPVVQAVFYAPVVPVMGEDIGGLAWRADKLMMPVTASQETFAPSRSFRDKLILSVFLLVSGCTGLVARITHVSVWARIGRGRRCR